MRKYFKRRDDEQSDALERIKMLFSLAKQEFPKHRDRANRYAEMINLIIKKVRVRPDKAIRLFICKECNHLLVRGVNLEVKQEGEFYIYKCLDCGNIKKYGPPKEGMRDED